MPILVILLLFLAGEASAQTVRGVVVGEDDGPIEGAQVVLDRHVVTTNAEGEFRLSHVGAGRHTILVRMVGYHPTRTDITVGADEPPPLRITLVAIPPYMLPPVVVSGTRTGLYGVVGDSSFQPVRGARVELMGPRGRVRFTDAEGRFAFPDARGDFLVRITLPGHRERRMGITIPPDSGREVTVRLWAAGENYRPPGRMQVAALRDLERRLAWAWSRDVLTRQDLEKFGARPLCDIPIIAAILGGTNFARLDGWDIIADVCDWRADQVELIELSWTLMSRRRPAGPTSGWPQGRRGSITVWQRW
jgi:hypothetical protein